MITKGYQFYSSLRDVIDKQFNLEEVKLLCFDLGIDFDNLAGDIKVAKVQSLIIGLNKQSLLSELIYRLQQIRPNFQWSDIQPTDFLQPYRGLFAFREEDSSFFFGREKVIAQLLSTVSQKPLVALVGPSGSGKSSVVFAGLIPQLRKQLNWCIVDVRPGSQPFYTLAGAFLKELNQPLVVKEVAGELQRKELSLADISQRLLNKSSKLDHLLLIVDQFEELYTICADASIRQQFIDMLLAAEESYQLTILLSMRADFLEQATTCRPFADALQRATYILGPMNREELGKAIEEPALVAGISFEAGLVSRILDDLHDEPGKLPILEFALTLLWAQQKHFSLTHAAYESIGEVNGALARYAESVYVNLEKFQQGQMRRIFVQLVQPGVGTEDTRRLASLSEVGEKNWDLVVLLADRRLVVTNNLPDGEETVEVVHEALIKGWGRLKGWMDADRRFREWQERLRVAWRQWEVTGRDQSALLRGAVLIEAEDWLEKRTDDLGAQEKMYIDRSIATREEDQARSQRRRNMVVGVALFVAVLFAVLGLFSYGQSKELAVESMRAVNSEGTAVANAIGLATEVSIRTTAQAEAVSSQERAESSSQIAEREALISRSRELAAISLAQLNDDAERGLLIAIEAFETAPTLQAEAALRQLLLASKARSRIPGHNGYGVDIAWGIDGKSLAIISANDTVVVWDVVKLSQLYTLQSDGIKINTIDWHPDESYLAASLANGTIVIWDVTVGNLLHTFTVNYLFTENLRWSSNGQRLVASGCFPEQSGQFGCLESEIFVWNVFGNQNPQVIERISCDNDAQGCGVEDIEWSPDGTVITAAIGDGSIRLWDSNSFLEIANLSLDRSAIYDIDWSPDGRSLATIGFNMVRVLSFPELEVTNTALANPTHGVSNKAVSIDWSPDGERLVFNGQDSKIRVLEIDSGEVSLLTGHNDDIMSLRWSPDNTFIASSSRDGNTILWDTGLGESAILLSQGLGYSVDSISWHPDNNQLAFNYYSLEIWDNDLNKWVRVPEFRPRNAIAWNPDGTLLAFDFDNNAVKIVDAISFEDVTTLHGHSEPVKSIAWNSEGTLISTASEDDSVRIWDVETGQEVTRIEPSNAVSTDNSPAVVDWSPDDRYLAFSLQSETMWIWDLHLSTGKLITVTDHLWVSDIDWSPDGTKIATASGEGQVWDAVTGEKLFSLIIERNNLLEGIFSLAWSPDSRLLATGEDDGTIRIWNIETRQNMITFSDHRETVNTLDWSEDGRLLASGSQDFTARIYYMDVNEVVEIAKRQISWQVLPNNELVQRQLTSNERQKYLNELSVDTTPVP